MSERVLVIIPAYNEAETIQEVVESIYALEGEYDVLVVNDGSSDETGTVVKGLDRAHLIELPYNLGIGSTMQTGFKYALRSGYGFAVQCDGDGQHPVDAIPALVERVQKGDADLVIGSRYVADTSYQPSFSRRVGKSLLSRLVDALIGGGITDTTSGFRCMNRKVLAVFAERYPEDYPEPESLVLLHRWGLRVVEIPVEMRPRQGGRSSISPRHAAYYMVKVALAIFVDMFRKFTQTTGDHS